MPKKSKFFFTSVLILTFALTIALADLFSSVITIGNFAFLPSQSVKSSGYKIYAISLNKAQTHAQASTQIQDIKLRGGAGYIYSNSGLYYCIASAYENQNDALNVQTNLQEKDISSEIIEITINEISIDTTFTGSEKNSLLEVLSSFKNTFKTLYDLSISLDTGTKDVIQCKVDVQSHYNKVVKIKQDYENIFKNKLTSEIFQTKLKLTEHLTIIESIINLDLNEKVLLSSQIKECYLKIVILNKELANDLSQ